MDFSVYFFSANDKHDFGARYEFILDVARFIDERGFTAMWTPERHFQEFGGSFPNPAVLSAALAVATKRIQLRAGSVVLPHHHPVRVVEEWSLVDQLSHGRAGLCVATGWHQGDFVFYPDNYETRREYAFGHIETLQALWRGDEVAFPGPGGNTLSVRTFPRPQQRELPLWLVYTSNPQTWVTAGEKGLNVLSLLDSWERLEQNIASYRQARERAGHDPDTGIVTVGMHTYVGENEDEVWERVRTPVKNYLASFMSQKRNHETVSGPARSTDTTEQDRLADMMAEDYYTRRSLLGTVDKCAKVVGKLERIGVTELACLVDFGLPFDTVMEALPNLDALRQQTTTQPTSADNGVGWYYNR